MANHRTEVVTLKKEGLRDAEIARKVGISKQRVAQISKPGLKQDEPSKLMLTVGEVSQLLGVHVNTVRRWTNAGILRACRICARGDRRYRREDIEDFLKARSEKMKGIGLLVSESK